MKIAEHAVTFGVTGSSNVLLVGKVYNGTEYERQIMSGDMVETGLTLEFTLDIYEPNKHVEYWVVDNTIVPFTEGLLTYSLVVGNGDVDVLAVLAETSYAVTYSATTSDGTIQGYYAETMPFVSGTSLFGDAELKFVLAA